MTEREDTRTLPEGATPATTPTVSQDIGYVLMSLVDSMGAVQDGLFALLNVAADNEDDFAKTAHWMADHIHDRFTHCMSLATTAHEACRIANQSPLKDIAEEAESAAARLRAFVAVEPEVMPHMTAQRAVDGAVADAVFILARALNWGTFEPMREGLRRAGIAAPVGEA